MPSFMRPKDYPEEILLIDISGAVLLPKGQLPITLERRHEPTLMKACSKDRLVGLVQKMDSGKEDRNPSFFKAGCLGRISVFSENDTEGPFVIVTGLMRFRIIETRQDQDKNLLAKVTYHPFSFDGIEGDESVEDREKFLELVRGYCHLHDINPNWDDVLKSSDEALVTSLAMMCPFSAKERQALLETPDLRGRERMMMALMEVACLKDQTPAWHWH